MGCRASGSDAQEFSQNLVEDVWYPDFCMRGKNHVTRVRAPENFKRFCGKCGCNVKTDVRQMHLEVSLELYGGISIPLSKSILGVPAATSGGGSRKEPLSVEEEATISDAAATTGPTQIKSNTEDNQSQGKKQKFSEIVRRADTGRISPHFYVCSCCNKREKFTIAGVNKEISKTVRILHEKDFKDYTGPKIVVFTGKKQFLSLMSSQSGNYACSKNVGGRTASFRYGKQEQCKLLNFPFPNAEIWVLPSTSGRAVLTKDERYGPYRKLRERLTEL